MTPLRTCPVSSLPPEIASQIFLHCLPPSHSRRYSPQNAPWLLLQVSRQWRALALDTHDLWNSIHTSYMDSSVEALETWLARAGDLPLTLSLINYDPELSDSLLNVSMRYCHQWQNVELHLPLSSLCKLDMPDHTFPVLRKLLLAVTSWDVSGKTIIIRDAPLLREVRFVSRLSVRLPWEQLTTLELPPWSPEQGFTILKRCLELVHLTYAWQGPSRAADAVNLPVLTLPFLQSLNCPGRSVLPHLTLPSLQHLSINHNIQRLPESLEPLIARSSCTLQRLSAWVVGGIDHDPSWRCFEAVVDLELNSLSPFLLLAAALQSTHVFPQLRNLHICDATAGNDWEPILVLLRSRREVIPSRATLESFELSLLTHSGLVSRRRGLSHRFLDDSTMPQFRSLAEAGLRIRIDNGTPEGSLEPSIIFDTFTQEQQYWNPRF